MTDQATILLSFNLLECLDDRCRRQTKESDFKTGAIESILVEVECKNLTHSMLLLTFIGI